MIKKLIDFIKRLFCKDCSIKAKAIIVKPSEEKQELLDKKENLQKLTKAVNKSTKLVNKKNNNVV